MFCWERKKDSEECGPVVPLTCNSGEAELVSAQEQVALARGPGGQCTLGCHGDEGAGVTLGSMKTLFLGFACACVQGRHTTWGDLFVKAH